MRGALHLSSMAMLATVVVSLQFGCSGRRPSLDDAGDDGQDAGIAVPTDDGGETADAGDRDGGEGRLDAGGIDAGDTDAGLPATELDAGPLDAGPSDAGRVDGGSSGVDAGASDAGTTVVTQACFGRWCWESPFELAQLFTAVWPTASGDVWLSSRSGGLVRFDGRDFHPVFVRSGERSVGVERFWAPPDDEYGDIYGAGTDLVYFDGAMWHVLLPDAFLHDIHGSGPDDIWVIGDGDRTAHFDGQTWTWHALPASDGFDSMRVRVTDDGVAFAVTADRLHTFTTTWTPVAGVANESSGSNAAMTSFGLQLHVAIENALFQNDSLGRFSRSSANLPVALEVVPAGIVGLSAYGSVSLRRDGMPLWEQLRSDVSGMQQSHEGRLVAAVRFGGVAELVDGGFTDLASPRYPIGALLLATGGDAGVTTVRATYVENALGLSIKSPDGVIREVVVPSGYSDVAGTGPADIWIAGSYGVHHFDGTSWSAQDVLGTGLCALGSTDVYLWGGQNELFHYDGEGWTSLGYDSNFGRHLCVAGSGVYNSSLFGTFHSSQGAQTRGIGVRDTGSVAASLGDAVVANTPYGELHVGPGGLELLRHDGNAPAFIVGVSPSDYWRIGYAQVLHHVVDGVASEVLRPEGNVVGAAAFPGQLLLYCSDGAVLWWTAAGFVEVPASMSGIWAPSAVGPAEAYVMVGTALVRFDGEEWTTMVDLGFIGTAFAVAPEDVWVAGEGRIAHVVSGVVTEYEAESNYASSIVALAPDDVYLADERLWHFNGMEWSDTGLPARWIARRGDVVVAAHPGYDTSTIRPTLYQIEGGLISQLRAPWKPVRVERRGDADYILDQDGYGFVHDASGVRALSPAEVGAAFADDVILFERSGQNSECERRIVELRDGGFVPIDTGYALWALETFETADGDVYVAGCDGAVVHRSESFHDIDAGVFDAGPPRYGFVDTAGDTGWPGIDLLEGQAWVSAEGVDVRIKLSSRPFAGPQNESFTFCVDTDRDSPAGDGCFAAFESDMSYSFSGNNGITASGGDACTRVSFNDATNTMRVQIKASHPVYVTGPFYFGVSAKVDGAESDPAGRDQTSTPGHIKSSLGPAPPFVGSSLCAGW